jgi:hypothetical protein
MLRLSNRQRLFQFRHFPFSPQNPFEFEIKNEPMEIIFRCRMDLTTDPLSEGNHESIPQFHIH